jgi:hypothetical protein
MLNEIILKLPVNIVVTDLCVHGEEIQRRRRGGRRGREGATRNKRHEPTVMEIVADRWEPATLFIVSGVSGASPV